MKTGSVRREAGDGLGLKGRKQEAAVERGMGRSGVQLEKRKTRGRRRTALTHF